MRKTLLGFLMVAVIGVSCLAASTLSADNATYEFGSVLEGTIVIHTFVLTNAGDQPIEITKVRASCGCTATAISNRSLAPGDSVQLEARVDTSGFGGKIVKTVYVDYGAPGAETQTTMPLYISGTVLRAQAYHITVGDLNYLFYVMIDLRDPSAYAAGHLMGAINIPYAEFSSWIDRLPKGVIIVLYDQTGVQSDAAVQVLLTAGFHEARSLLGGFDAWTLAFHDQFLLSSP